MQQPPSEDLLTHRAGLDDHGDTEATATPISGSEGVITGTFEVEEDVDVFALSTLPDHYYSFSCLRVGWTDCPGFVQGVSGQWFWRSNGAPIFFFKATGTGPIPIVMYAAGSAGTYTLEVQDLGLDDHGDSAASATPSTPSSTPIQGAIESPIDRDVFSFTAQAGHVYQFLCDAVPSQAAWYLEFRDPAGTLLDKAWLGMDVTSVTAAEISSPGTYTITVSPEVDALRSGTYSCRLEDIGSDDHGDTIAAATPVTPASPALNVAGRMDTRQDVDVFSFSAQAGHTYRATLKPGTFAGPTRLQLKNASGTVLDSQQTVFLQRTATVNETWFLEVQTDITSTTLGTYSLDFVDFGVDDHGNTIALATPITPGSITSGFHQNSSDLDFFTFSATADTLYRVACITCTVEIRTATGTVSRFATGSNPTWYNFEAPATGPLYIRTSSSGGTYTVELQETGHDDFGDTTATAEPLTLGVSKTGNMEIIFDKDVFSIPLTGGQAYTLSLNNGNRFIATLFAPDGTTVPRNITGNFTAPATGTYFVQVTSNVTATQFPTGFYFLQIQ
ncbi:PPC domain-containing protein [Hyalangium versicolor]|uniref:PPC domain-containing protein n=1 Tax=Hyalangium versicolor TaxID=2861190 RepID=UPI001CCD8AEA|nr:PPC domain-containing protein [Hyalangium versicolor]